MNEKEILALEDKRFGAMIARPIQDDSDPPQGLGDPSTGRLEMRQTDFATAAAC
jgi:hypothetical protein